MLPPPSLPLHLHAYHVLAALDQHCRDERYLSWCPFDGLNSELFKATPFASMPFARLAWLQLFKRLPLNLRPLCRVPKRLNAKTLALLARSYELTGHHADAIDMRETLLTLRCDPSLWGEAAWGYPFPWQARAFYVPEGTPNVIVTAYAARALEDQPQYLHASAAFIEAYLLRIQGERCYIAYVPGSDALVHNASLWGAYVLSASFANGGPARYKPLAEQVIATALEAQEADGSWPYGERHHHGWKDSYHTGYMLEALHLCGEKLGTKAYAPAIERGMAYYVSRFFHADGHPALYHDRAYPIDTEAAAQALITFSLLPFPQHQALMERVLAWSLTHLWLPEKQHFLYQKYSPRRSNRINYLRWTQAWMHLGLSHSLQRLAALPIEGRP